MIVLDTNVLSEPLRPEPDQRVLSWLASHPIAAVTAVSVGELLGGVLRLPTGRRREALATSIREALDGAGEILPYDEPAARVFAEIQDARRRMGRPLSTEDGMIAAICLARGASLATRNISDFDGLGVELVNPWES